MSTTPASLTLQNIVDLTRNLISDNVNFTATAPGSLSPQTWSEQQVYDSINNAIKLYSLSTGATYKDATVALSVGGLATIPTAFIDIERVAYPAWANTVVITFDLRGLEATPTITGTGILESTVEL